MTAYIISTFSFVTMCIVTYFLSGFLLRYVRSRVAWLKERKVTRSRKINVFIIFGAVLLVNALFSIRGITIESTPLIFDSLYGIALGMVPVFFFGQKEGGSDHGE
jgi:di/tricarboxylate transporter